LTRRDDTEKESGGDGETVREKGETKEYRGDSRSQAERLMDQERQ
jgi:hypothetical protein